MSTEPSIGVGSTLGSYRVDAELGQGGMGVVYRAEDLRLGRRVALKLLRASLADDDSYRERFLRESRLAASIEHAAIVPIYEAGETDGLLYIAMRFVDGVDLAELLRREGPLAPGRAVALVGQLASALDAAHARGLIHRDVKPSNALIGTDGDGEHAYLVDFGITQDTTAQERLTATDQLVGTLDYLAPERIRGEPVDGRADIYSLGCVLFECLTGQVPFPRGSEASAIYAHLEEQPPRVSELRPELPKALDDVVARALSKDRADRWQSGAELRVAAQGAISSGATRRAFPFRGRIAAVALVALAVAGGAGLLLGGDDDTGLAAIEANTVGLIDADGRGIRAQYSVGRDPSAIAVGAGSVWVANRLDGTVSRVTRARRESVPIPVGGEPTGLAFGAGTLWVADGQGRKLSQLDPGQNKVVNQYDVGNATVAIAVGAGAVWAASAVDATVARVDLKSGEVTKRIAVVGRPSALAAGAGAIWVASEDAASVMRLDPRSGTPLDSIPVGTGPSGIAVGTDAVWVTNRRDGTVTRIDPAAGKAADLVPVGGEPRAIAADPKGVWVANDGNATVVRIDPESGDVTDTVGVKSRPSALAIVDGAVWTAALAAPSTHRGGTLRVAFSSAHGIFNSERYGFGPAYLGPGSLMYDGLIAYRRAGGSAGTALVGDLATDVPQPSPDRLSYRFRLRPNLRFSDGAPVTPEDVRASVARRLAFGDPGSFDPTDTIKGAARCTDPRLSARARFRQCDLSDGIETDAAARTVTFRLSRPDVDFLHKLAPLQVLPAGSPGEELRTPTAPGTGPYMVERWGRRSGLLVRNPRFRAWTPDRPDGFADRISFRYQLTDAQIAAVEKGAADIALFDGTTDFAPRVRARHSARLHADLAPGTAYAFLNVRTPPFDDPRARRALNYAVDRRRLAELMSEGVTHQPTCQMLPPGFQGYTPSCRYTVNPGSGTWSGPDLAKARRLVAASGTRGMKVEFWGSNLDAPFGTYMRRVLNQIGYRGSLRSFDGVGGIAQNATGGPHPRPQIGLWFWYANSAAPLTFLRPLLTCSGELNFSHVCNRELDALMEQAAQARGPEATALWSRVETALADQAATVPLLNWATTALTGERVDNFQAHPLSGALLEQLWVE